MRRDKFDQRLIGAPNQLDGLELLGAIFAGIVLAILGLVVLAWRMQ